MIYLSYMLAELRRRRGRTLLTALGLAVGVGLVISVSALSAGLDRAQASVLEPLTGVGTDMSVNRPISLSRDPREAFQRLSPADRAQLRREFGERQVDFGSLAPGSKFTRTTFRSSQLSFPASRVETIASLSGVTSAAGGLTLSMSTISGTVPNQAQAQAQAAGGEGGHGGEGGGEGAGGEAGELGHGNANVNATTVAGVDPAKDDLGAITSRQLTQGRWFSSGAREAIVDVAYARTRGKGVGSSIAVGGRPYRVVGVVKTPLGGTGADVYVKLAQLQRASGRTGRVNAVFVRAASAGDVDTVAKAITASFDGASVTTAKTLADRVSGSLASAKSLTEKLGLALELVGLLGAVLIASLLSLSSVTKRVRELGTLKALGWSRGLVVRQVTGESLLQGLAGGVLGIAVGLAGAALITLLMPPLRATVASATPQGGFSGPFGGDEVTASAASQAVSLTARVSPGVVLVAVALAVAGGLVAGAAGALRASRLRPVEALRHID